MYLEKPKHLITWNGGSSYFTLHIDEVVLEGWN